MHNAAMCYCIFSGVGRERLTDAKSVLIEIKRSSTQFNIALGLSQRDAYVNAASGFYDEGYLGAPFVEEGKGIVSFNQNGELIFRKADAYNSAVPDEARQAKQEQVKEVEDLMKYELLKNLTMPEIIDICGSEHSRTYQDVLKRINSLDIVSITEMVMQ